MTADVNVWVTNSHRSGDNVVTVDRFANAVGYLTVIVDMSGTGTLSINFKSTADNPARDSVTVDIPRAPTAPAGAPTGAEVPPVGAQ